MTKRKSKAKTAKKPLLLPTPREELARLLGTAIRGSAIIPAVGVTYRLEWQMRDGDCYATLRIVSVNRKPTRGNLTMTRL